MTLACIGLGSNVGNSQETLTRALASLQSTENLQLHKCSSCYLSKPWGVANQPDFLNAVIGIHTELSARDLLHYLQEVEWQFGRERVEKWGPRTLDLDILCYGELKQSNPELQLPHPYFAERDFVLVPLAEIYPDLIISGSKVSEWLDRYLRNNPDRELPEKLGFFLV